MKIVTTHSTADFDGFASMVAACKLFADLHMVFSGTQERSLREYLAAAPRHYQTRGLKHLDLNGIDEVILVDTADLNRIGPIAEIARRPGVRLRVFDHHPPEERLPSVEYIIRERGSTTTIFVELMREHGIEVSPDEATLLALGLYEDTCSLVSLDTTPEDLQAGAYVVEQGADLSAVFSYLHPAMNREQLDLLNQLIIGMDSHHVYGVPVSITTGVTEDYVPEAAMVVHRLCEISNPQVLIALVQMDEKVHCIARSRNAVADVGVVASAFGGGGHASAASACLKDENLTEAKDHLLFVLRREIGKRRTARDIMRPLGRSVAPSAPMREALALMQQGREEVLPVVRDEAFAGVISRRITEQAVSHGLGDAPIADYLDHEVAAVSPETSLSDVEARLFDSHAPYVIILDPQDRRPLGAVTAADLWMPLSPTGREDAAPPRMSDALVHPVGKNLSRLLREHLPAHIQTLLEAAAAIGDRLGVQVYVVGGLVRDLLLKLENDDVDLVIEGDGLAFARELGTALGAKVRIHQKFGTALLVFPDGFRLDVATARTEVYDAPGRLPDVAMSSLRDDLSRRDFTINTLAIKLNGADANHLIDFFGGQRDLKTGVVRVLHSLSFVDDPTRAFRAIRFEQRFHMHLSRQTLRLLKNAVKSDLFAHLEGYRIFNELRAILQEHDPLASLRRLAQLDLLAAIHPKLRFKLEHDRLFQDLRDALAWYDFEFAETERIRHWVVYVLALLVQLPAGDAERLIHRLAIGRGRGVLARKLIADHAVLPEVKRALRRSSLPATELVLQCERLTAEGRIVLLASLDDDRLRRAVIHYLERLRYVAPELSGRDLIDLGLTPGPSFKRILEELKGRKLCGDLPSREAEMNFVREMYLPDRAATAVRSES